MAVGALEGLPGGLETAIVEGMGLGSRAASELVKVRWSRMTPAERSEGQRKAAVKGWKTRRKKKGKSK